jgi:hypothetical protein
MPLKEKAGAAMKVEARRFQKRYGAAADAIARLDIDQPDREKVAHALAQAFTGQPDFKAETFWLLAADPLCPCAGTADGPCPAGREIRVAMHDRHAPDGHSEAWARRKPLVWCAACGPGMSADPAPRAAISLPSDAELGVTVSTLDWLLAIVEEHDRDDLERPLRFARALAERVRAGGSIG